MQLSANIYSKLKNNIVNKASSGIGYVKNSTGKISRSIRRTFADRDIIISIGKTLIRKVSSLTTNSTEPDNDRIEKIIKDDAKLDNASQIENIITYVNKKYTARYGLLGSRDKTRKQFLLEKLYNLKKEITAKNTKNLENAAKAVKVEDMVLRFNKDPVANNSELIAECANAGLKTEESKVEELRSEINFLNMITSGDATPNNVEFSAKLNKALSDKIDLNNLYLTIKNALTTTTTTTTTTTDLVSELETDINIVYTNLAFIIYYVLNEDTVIDIFKNKSNQKKTDLNKYRTDIFQKNAKVMSSTINADKRSDLIFDIVYDILDDFNTNKILDAAKFKSNLMAKLEISNTLEDKDKKYFNTFFENPRNLEIISVNYPTVDASRKAENDNLSKLLSSLQSLKASFEFSEKRPAGDSLKTKADDYSKKIITEISKMDKSIINNNAFWTETTFVSNQISGKIQIVEKAITQHKEKEPNLNLDATDYTVTFSNFKDLETEYVNVIINYAKYQFYQNVISKLDKVDATNNPIQIIMDPLKHIVESSATDTYVLTTGGKRRTLKKRHNKYSKKMRRVNRDKSRRANKKRSYKRY